MDEDAVFDMPAHGARQHGPFDVAAGPFDIIQVFPMSNMADILVDNRAVIEVAGDIVRGGPDQFYSAFIGHGKRIGADKCREKTMMYIDDAIGIMRHKG